jgi:hypothetical protein
MLLRRAGHWRVLPVIRFVACRNPITRPADAIGNAVPPKPLKKTSEQS